MEAKWSRDLGRVDSEDKTDAGQPSSAVIRAGVRSGTTGSPLLLLESLRPVDLSRAHCQGAGSSGSWARGGFTCVSSLDDAVVSSQQG